MRYRLEVDRETDGRWIAEVTDLPCVLAYGDTEDAAVQAAITLALRVLADRVQHGEADARRLADRILARS